MGLLAFFLLIYQGYNGFKPIDFWVSSLAGLSALSLLLFPTDNISSMANRSCNSCAITYLSNTETTRILIHYVSAGLFLSCLAFMSFFLFTKSPHKDRMVRNWVYRGMGLLMVIAMLIIFFQNQLFGDKAELYNITFWMEVLALEAFAVSWFLKGMP